MVKLFARIQRPSLRWGLICGLILGVAEIIFGFATSFITQESIQPVLATVPIVLFLVLGFFAGLRATQETGRWVSGLIAGIWVGVIGTVIADLIPLANTIINLQSIVASTQLYIKTHPAQANGMKPGDYTASSAIVLAVLELLVSVINSAFYTLVGGSLGGFVRRRRALASTASGKQVYEEAMFEEPTAATDVQGEQATAEKTVAVPDTENEEAKDDTAK